MPITRDDLLHDRLREHLRQEIAAGEPHDMLDEAQFEASRARILEEMSGCDELWIFAYGSLIWNPTFEYDRCEVATLPGLARRFCLWAWRGRGSPERPGLWLGLDEGDSCTGMAFRVPDAARDLETLMLWRREMGSGAYVPVVLPVRIGQTMKPCICLRANHQHRRYAGVMPTERIVEAIATASGHLGTCREYLFNLVDKLASVGVSDPELDVLVRAVNDWPKAASRD